MSTCDLAVESSKANLPVAKAKELTDQAMAELQSTDKEGWTIWEFVLLDKAFAQFRERDEAKAYLAAKKVKK